MLRSQRNQLCYARTQSNNSSLLGSQLETIDLDELGFAFIDNDSLLCGGYFEGSEPQWPMVTKVPTGRQTTGLLY